MARKINDFFFEDNPPFETVTMEKEPSMLEAPVNPEPEEAPEFSYLAKEAIGLTPGQSPVNSELVQERNADNAPITPANSLPAGKVPVKNPDIASPEQHSESNPTTEQSPEVTPEKTDHYKSLDQIREEVKAGYNPIMSLLQSNKPVLDEKKQQRLQRIAAVNSIGKGLGTVLQGFYGARNANIPQDKSTLLPESYNEYIANTKEHGAKMDSWNKDMMALSLKQQGDIDRKVEKMEDTKRADKIAADAAARQQAQFDAQMKRQQDQFDAEMEYKNKIAAAKTPDDIKLLQEQHKNRMAEINATYANQQKLQTQAIEAGKWQPKTGGSSIERPAGAENAPLAFRSNGKQVIINADQLDIVPELITKAASDMTDVNYMMNKKMYDKIMADGKISESEARLILSQYGDKYYDFSNGVAVPKSDNTTGGAY